MDSNLIEEDDSQPESMSLDDIKHGRLESTNPPETGIWDEATRIELMYSNLSELPLSPNSPLLRVLLLQGNAELMEIPPLFFNHTPLLRALDLSYTSITHLPSSFFGLVELRKLYLRGCELFMEIPPEIGQLKKLEELDLNESQISHVPIEIQELIKLQKLCLSFYEYDQNIGQVIPKGLISKLTPLSYLSIDVNPDHSKWDETVQVVLQEISQLCLLRTLILYVPRVELLKHIPKNKYLDFRIVAGHHMQRIISRVPTMVEEKFKQRNRSLRLVYGVDIPTELKRVLRDTYTFFLDRHVTIKHLSEFGLMNLKQLKVCILAECNEMQTIVEKGYSYINAGNLACLQVLSVFYMKNLRSIWEGNTPSSLFLGQLKSLTLHTCPNLTTVFTLDFIDCLVNLKELLLQDCPKVTTLVTHKSSAFGLKYYLPNIRKISLLYLPEFVSIFSGLRVGPNLEKIGFYYCPKLQHLSTRELCSQRLKLIKGETKWWEALRWKMAISGQNNLKGLFSPIDEDVDIMTQLVANVDESSSSKNIEIHDEFGDWGQMNLANELVQGKELLRQLQIYLSEPSPSRGTFKVLFPKITASFENASQPTGISINEDSDRKREDFDPMLVEKSHAASLKNNVFPLVKFMKRLSSLELLNQMRILKSVLAENQGLQLRFTKNLPLSIFANSKVKYIDGNPITAVLVDKIDPTVPMSLPDPIKLEIVVLDGDFPFEDNDDWTSEEFNGHIVKERTGRPPLLTGELNVTMPGGIAPIEDIEFTDNSSWTRSMKFKIAVRVDARGVRIREGITEAFVVMDSHGEDGSCLNYSSHKGKENDGLRKLKDDNKKSMRKETEKRRRREMETLYASLRSLLPLEYIKGKCSASDHLHEAVNYILHLRNKLTQLQAKRDELMKLSNLSFVGSVEISTHLPTCVIVHPCLDGIEIVCTNLKQHAFPLSSLLDLVQREGLNVVSCASAKANEQRFLHAIRSEVSDMAQMDFSELKRKLNERISSSSFPAMFD